MSDTPLVYDSPDQGYDVTLRRTDGVVSIALPPVNLVHIDIAIRRVGSLLRLLEDMKEEYGISPTRRRRP